LRIEDRRLRIEDWGLGRREMTVKSYQNLDVWKNSIDLVVDVYKLTKKLPPEERYCLSDQMRRAVISIPSNIAEGQKRFTISDTVHFCSIALGSLAELETQILIVHKVYDLNVTDLQSKCEIISRMLHALIRSLRARQ